MASAFKPTDFQLAIFSDCKEAIRHRHIHVLLGREKDDIAVDGLNRQRKAGSMLDLLGEPLVVLARRSFFPNI